MPEVGDAERLVVLLEARIRDFEKNMAKADGTATRSYDRMRRGSRSATRQMEQDMARSTGRINQMLASTSTKIGSYGKAFVGGLVGGLVAGGVAGVASRIGEIAKSVASVGDEARRAGVSAKAFQEWRFVAEQNRIGVDSLVDGLKELNLRADEWISTGSGPAAEAFQRLGYSASDLKTKLADPSALLLEIIGRLGQMDKAAQIRIADELFGGTGGERFVELIAQGEDGIRATIDRAHELGIVMDDDLIASAAELDRKFNAVSNTVGTALKSAIVSAAESLSDFIAAFNGFEFERSAKLGERMAALGRERLNIEQKLGDLRDRQRRGEGAGDGILGSSIGESSVSEAKADLDRRMEALAAEETMINEVLASREKLNGAKPASTWTPPTPPPGGFGSSSSKGAKERADEYERLTQRVTEATAAQMAETEAQRQLNPLVDDYGYTIERARMEHELLTAAQEAGRQITPELRAEIENLAHAYATTSAEAERLSEAQDEMRESVEFRKGLLSGALTDLRSALADGKLEFEELGDIAMNVLDKIISKIQDELVDALFSGKGGGFFGMLMSLFGGGFGGGVPGIAGANTWSEGGYTGSGGKHEPAGIVHRNEVVWSQDDVRRHGGPARVNAMRKALPGYANGGIVGGGSGGSGGGGLNVIINNAPPGTTAREESGTGIDQKRMRNLVIDIYQKDIATGGADRTMKRYGTPPVKVRRG